MAMKTALGTQFPLLIGQKIERIRTYKGIKQEYLAAKLGMSQSRVSKIEKQENIEAGLLKQIAYILEVSTDTIQSFNDDLITYNINNTIDKEISQPTGNISEDHFQPAVFFNLITELYERLLISEREKIELLRSLVN